MRITPRCFVLVAWLLGAAPLTQAAELAAAVTNDEGEPVAKAVVYALPVGGNPAGTAPAPAVIDQVDKEFVPALTVVYRGAQVSFPNNDNIRHHVYSFSKGNAFEIPLDADETAPPVAFENPGVVALGCNVHDWMSAHVFVADTPYFAVTDAGGNARLSELPAGEYDVEVWHVQLRGKPARTRQRVMLTGDAEVSFSIRQKPVWRAWREGGSFEEGY